jgi:hypothetical protein
MEMQMNKELLKIINEEAEAKKIREVRSRFQKDCLLSCVYLTAKCTGAITGIYGIMNCLNDLSMGQYAQASLNATLSLGCYGFYRFMDKLDEETKRKIHKNQSYLEEKAREHY